MAARPIRKPRELPGAPETGGEGNSAAGRQKTNRERARELQKVLNEIYETANSVNKYESAYRTVKLLQHSGVISDLAAMCLIEHNLSILTDCLVTFSKFNNRLKEIGERLFMFEKKHHVNIDQIPACRWPEEMQAVENEWKDEALRIRLRIFRFYGEHELADLLAKDPEAFERRFHSFAILEHMKADW